MCVCVCEGIRKKIAATKNNIFNVFLGSNKVEKVKLTLIA